MEHLAGSEFASVTTAFRFPCLAAIETTLGFVGITLGLEEFLLRSAEDEGCSTIGTRKRLILETQRTDDLLSLKVG